jgi:hypothetical protein
MDFKNPPSVADLLAAIEPQPFHIVVTGHVALERVIEICIIESLPTPAALDLKRVSFSQKLALSISLGILEESSMPAYKALNALRNRVAHDLLLAFDKQAALDLRNCLSVAQRTGLSSSPTFDPLAVLREIIGALYSELRAALEHRRERRLRAQAYNDMTREALMSANYGQAFVEGRRSLEVELRKRVEAKKAELGWTYQSPAHADGPWDLYEFDYIAPH